MKQNTYKKGERVNYNILSFNWRADYGFTDGIYMGKTKNGLLKVVDTERLGLMKLEPSMVRPYNPKFKGLSEKKFWNLINNK